MAAVFKVAEGVPCRACGAVLAPMGKNDFGLCGNCWTSAILHCGGAVDLRRKDEHQPSKITEDDVNSWLAHKLTKDVRRLTRDGMVGRCEAVSGWGYGNPGSQCAKAATEYRDGHKVCYRHKHATAPVFVSDKQADHYEMMRGNILHLAAADPLFAKMIREAAEEVG